MASNQVIGDEGNDVHGGSFLNSSILAGDFTKISFSFSTGCLNLVTAHELFHIPMQRCATHTIMCQFRTAE
jgi:hypothetical protein